MPSSGSLAKLCFPIKRTSFIEVTNTAEYLTILRSFTKWILGGGSFTSSPSSKSRKFFLSVIYYLQQNSFKRTISAVSAMHIPLL